MAFDRDLGALGKLHRRLDGTYLLRCNVNDSTRTTHEKGNADGTPTR